MRKRYAHAAMLLAATVLFLLPALTPVYSQGQDDYIELSNDQFENPQRPSVKFPHDAHNSAAELEDRCWYCHHMDGSNPSEDDSSEGIACADCHAVDADAGTTNLMDAYHGQCITCHEEEGKGPIACGECHVK